MTKSIITVPNGFSLRTNDKRQQQLVRNRGQSVLIFAIPEGIFPPQTRAFTLFLSLLPRDRSPRGSDPRTRHGAPLFVASGEGDDSRRSVTVLPLPPANE